MAACASTAAVILMSPATRSTVWEPADSPRLAERLGAGPLRCPHRRGGRGPLCLGRNRRDQPHGAIPPARLRLDSAATSLDPTPAAVAALHAPRCGGSSGQQLGMVLLEGARAHGVRLLSGRCHRRAVGRRARGRRHGGKRRRGSADRHAALCQRRWAVVKQVGALLGLELPIFSELHLKSARRTSLASTPTPLWAIWVGCAAPALARGGTRRAGRAATTARTAGPLPRRHSLPPRRRAGGRHAAAAVGLSPPPGRCLCFPLPNDPWSLARLCCAA